MTVPAYSKMPLAYPVRVGTLFTLSTVGDVRRFIAKQLPPEFRAFSTWQYVDGLAEEAAASGDANDLTIALKLALMIGGALGKQPANIKPLRRRKATI